MSIAQFTTDERYRRRFWAGARVGALGLAEVRPNAGHIAVAALEQAGRFGGVITQNVDGLHSRAGTVNLAELHGNGATTRCIPEGHTVSRAELRGIPVAVINRGATRIDHRVSLRLRINAGTSETLTELARALGA